MIGETTPSQKAIWDERISGIKNTVWEWCEKNPKTAMALFVVAVLILLALVFAGILKKVGPLEFSSASKKSKSTKKQKLPRQITDLPAPAPKNKTAKLPVRLRRISKKLEAGNRIRILIRCLDRRRAEELGKLLYCKLEESKTGDHIGWVSYRDLKDGHDIIDACVDRDFCIYNDNPDFLVRKSKRLDLLRDRKVHTILFVNVLEYAKEKDYILEQYNNLPGLSMILISSEVIEGYETYLFAEDGGEL